MDTYLKEKGVETELLLPLAMPHYSRRFISMLHWSGNGVQWKFLVIQCNQLYHFTDMHVKCWKKKNKANGSMCVFMGL